jgi:virulence-associated protein VagC
MAKKETISNIRNRTDIPQTEVEKNPKLRDFYSTYDKNKVTADDERNKDSFVNNLSPEEKALVAANKNYYVLNIKNKGGLVIFKMTFEDGTSEVVRIPAEIWRLNDKIVKKIIPTDKKVVKWTMDPYFETADIDTSDNAFPREPEEATKFQMFRARGKRPMNPMQEAAKSNSGTVPGAKN